MKPIILLLLSLMLSDCALNDQRTLELTDTMTLKAVEENENGLLYLHVSGASGHSSLGIQRVDLITKKSEIIIKPKLVIINLAKSGWFDITIQIPPNIQQVLYGDRECELWSRKGVDQTKPKRPECIPTTMSDVRDRTR